MKRTAPIVIALMLAGLVLTLTAHALTLGRLKVLSALGQPLLAEIEVPDISQDEANSLRVGIATSDAFKSAGLEYNAAAISSLTITGKRRTDGRALLELRTTQAVTEPFLDLVLEITWSTGRMVRDYTLLLDPQTGQVAPAVIPTPTLPIQSIAAASIAPITPKEATVAVINAPAAAVAINPFSTRTELRQAARAEARGKGRSTARAATEQQRMVAKGETAAQIAAAAKPDGVSLDQMLVALLQANPQAFVDGNVNRLKAGVLIDIPASEDAQAIAKSEAKNSIQAQARDFNDYRRKLAGLSGTVAPDTQARKASGAVVAKVEDKKQAITPPDRLTLSKSKETAVEDKIAKERATADSTARAAELQKNIQDLNKATTDKVAISAGAQTDAVGIPAGAPTVPTAVASSPSAAPAPTLAASQPAIAQVPPPLKKSNALLDQLIHHPWALPAGGGLLALLAGGALFGMRKRRQNEPQADEAVEAQGGSINFAATRQPNDTMFGTLGASHLDTQEATASTTMVYPPSQLHAASGDVDPIAEADVYLAYNRDVQAEEILKEAKAAAPQRADIQVKLMSIYAKRRDTEAFDAAAQELHLLTDGAGEHWIKARDLARDIGSNHRLFSVSASSFAVSEAHPAQPAYSNNSLSFAPSTNNVPFSTPLPAAPALAPAPMQGGLIDFDLSSLTLDLPAAPDHLPMFAPTQQQAQDPKLALAEEYLSIGDKAGARAIIQDVITHGDPQSLTAAQQMLARIG